MLRLGLTGGIASGKSAVAAMLREMGFAVLDADGLAHKLIEPGQPAYAEVLKEFGPSIVDPSGRVDRAKLGAIVFADQAKLDRLNAIVHPASPKSSSANSRPGGAVECATQFSSKPRCSSNPAFTKNSTAWWFAGAHRNSNSNASSRGGSAKPKPAAASPSSFL